MSFLSVVAGIYIHIPFCKQACNYCNFHFSTNTSKMDDMVDAIIKELELTHAYLADQPIETIYFGGGTPSILSIAHWEQLFKALHQTFDLTNVSEITAECNPDDLNEAYLRSLKSLGVNRLSIGIQSFKSEDLTYMNRAHDMNQSHNAITLAYETGFKDLSIDLIYGTPNLTNEEWITNIQTAIAYKVNHISAYALTVEPKTALDYQIKKGTSLPVKDEQMAEQFEILVSTLQAHGYEQYEISNFSLPNHRAQHNTNYWKGKHYLGLGPGAHSFNGVSRSYNISNNALYIQAIKQGDLPRETEILSFEDRWNEYIMTSLRTVWGSEAAYITTVFGAEYWHSLVQNAQRFSDKNWLVINEKSIQLTPEGKLYADYIASELFI